MILLSQRKLICVDGRNLLNTWYFKLLLGKPCSCSYMETHGKVMFELSFLQGKKEKEKRKEQGQEALGFNFWHTKHVQSVIRQQIDDDPSVCLQHNAAVSLNLQELSHLEWQQCVFNKGLIRPQFSFHLTTSPEKPKTWKLAQNMHSVVCVITITSRCQCGRLDS